MPSWHSPEIIKGGGNLVAENCFGAVTQVLLFEHHCERALICWIT